MIRQSAFVNAKKHLKGALHCHTTRSDGRGAPDETIRYHADHGYDFMAVTDHRIYNYLNYAPDTKMLIIPGMEMDRNLPGPGVHCHHIVCLGPEKEKGNGFEQDQRFESGRITKTSECQEMLDMLHANGNMTIYCHPEWSGVSAREFEDLKGNFAMEIWNSGCVIEDGKDQNAPYWDELLIQGKQIWGVATDDGHEMYQHCNGWVMVNSECNVGAVLEALKQGAFYSSTGPEIYDFYVEEGQAYVECSPVADIQFVHFRAPYRLVKGSMDHPITFGSTKIREGTEYIRAVVRDVEGRRAWTNPIFLNQNQ